MRLLVEQLAARAWPAAEAVEADGWLLRHTPALSRRRSNSALPLGAAPDAAMVEDFYASRGRRALVQIAPDTDRADLDEQLARRGWRRDGPTDVFVADADTTLARTQPGDVAVITFPASEGRLCRRRVRGRDWRSSSTSPASSLPPRGTHVRGV